MNTIKYSIIRSYSRCMHDGLTYALRNFRKLTCLSSLSLLILILVLFLAQIGLDKFLFTQTLNSTFSWKYLIYFLPVILICFAFVHLQMTFVIQQKTELIDEFLGQHVAEFSIRHKTLTGIRIFVINVFQLSILFFLVFLIFKLPSATIQSLLPYTQATLPLYFSFVFMILLCITAFLLIIGILRMLYNLYVYAGHSLWQAIRELIAYRHYLGRTITLEIVTMLIGLCLIIVFVGPWLITEYIHVCFQDALSHQSTIDMPAFFMPLRYFTVAIAALGAAFTIMLLSYPHYYNWCSIQQQEKERRQLI